jgi:DNA-binding LacI/PurR family transcriptional regulator
MAQRVTTDKAGVSRTTVSHVLNNHPGIVLSLKTRKRVLATARKLGYVPNSAARMLVTRRSRTIVGVRIFRTSAGKFNRNTRRSGQLPTIRSHPFELGKLLGEVAIALVAGKVVGSQQDVLPHELIRASCGRARLRPTPGIARCLVYDVAPSCRISRRHRHQGRASITQYR